MIKIVKHGVLDKYFAEIEMAERLRESADVIEQKAIESMQELIQASSFYYKGNQYQIKRRFNKNEGRKKAYLTGLEKAA